jgi:hypothetical protein
LLDVPNLLFLFAVSELQKLQQRRYQMKSIWQLSYRAGREKKQAMVDALLHFCMQVWQ